MEEGIWVEPAGAAPIAALSALLVQGHIKPDERVVCIMSGAGFKDSHLAEDQARAIGQQKVIPADVDAIFDALSAEIRA